MKVAQLAQLLDGLTLGLEGVLNATAVNDLKTFRTVMKPFADRTVNEFVAFLAQCEEYQRTGVVSGTKPRVTKKPAPGKAAPDPEQVVKAVAQVRTLLEDINRGLVDGRRIEDTLAQFKPLSQPQLDQLLVELSIAGKAKSKPAAIDKVRQVLKSQVEMYVKSHTGR